jgi:hypothetical protein
MLFMRLGHSLGVIGDLVTADGNMNFEHRMLNGEK